MPLFFQVSHFSTSPKYFSPKFYDEAIDAIQDIKVKQTKTKQTSLFPFTFLLAKHCNHNFIPNENIIRKKH
jgi:hypothetical protein